MGHEKLNDLVATANCDFVLAGLFLLLRKECSEGSERDFFTQSHASFGSVHQKYEGKDEFIVISHAFQSFLKPTFKNKSNVFL